MAQVIANIIERKLAHWRWRWGRMKRERAVRQAARMQQAYGLPEVSLESIAPSSKAVLPPIMDHMCLAPYISQSFATHDDYSALMKIILAQEPRTVIELGTAHGNTVANICKHSEQARIFTVNARAEEQTGTNATYSLSAEQIGSVYRDSGFGDRVVQIFSNTLNLDLAPYLKGQLAEVAIVDACHDTSYVINDFHKVIPFIAPKGIVLLHDTHPSMHEHLVGSYLACMRLRRAGFDIRHVRDTWWGIWTKPEAAPLC